MDDNNFDCSAPISLMHLSRYEKKGYDGFEGDIFYWSSSFDPDGVYGGKFVHLDGGQRFYVGGLPVRAVCP